MRKEKREEKEKKKAPNMKTDPSSQRSYTANAYALFSLFQKSDKIQLKMKD